MRKLFDKSWGIWLLLVVAWNYGWPNVPPLADVVVAVLLSIALTFFKNRK